MKLVQCSILLLTAMLAWSGLSVAQHVYVNQAGYLPDKQKLVYISVPADSFFVIDSATGEVEYNGMTTLLSPKDPSTGLAIRVGNFTSFGKIGSYRIATNISDTSFPFQISTDVFSNVWRKSAKGFYFQRCGIALLPEYAGVFAHSSCHSEDAVYHPSTGRSGTKRTAGGWHDAGDYGKYVVNAGVTVGTLLMAYEMFPAKFDCDDLNIPESGNSVPDILDETRYELEWLLEMQETTDGGVYSKVSTRNFPGFIMPENDTDTVFVYRESSAATADFAAVTAMAGRIYRRFDAAFADRCIQASEKAWQFLSTNSSIVPPGGFRNPVDTYTGEYGDRDDSDERLWAAAELFVTTEADSFGNYFKGHCDDRGLITSAMSWPNVRTLAQLEYLVAKPPAADTAITSRIRKALFDYCETLVRASSSDGFNVTLKPYEYRWGCNSAVLNNAILLIIGYKLSGDVRFYDAALDQLDYVLGCNMHNMSFVTGLGARYPMHIHHRPSGADGIAEPVPGLLAGGPDELLSDAVLRRMYNKRTPPAECYADDQGSYASNEICINWNAPLVFVAGYFNESSPR